MLGTSISIGGGATSRSLRWRAFRSGMASPSNIVASQGSPQYVPAAQLQQVQGQLANLQQHVESTVDEYKSAYQTQLRFDYAFEAHKGPFNIQPIYHNYDLRDGTYIIPKVMDNGYVELGKKKMEFSKRKG